MYCSRTQRSGADEAQTRSPSVSSQALYHCAPYADLYLLLLFILELYVGLTDTIAPLPPFLLKVLVLVLPNHFV